VFLLRGADSSYIIFVSVQSVPWLSRSVAASQLEGPGCIPGDTVWCLWCTEWHWDTFRSEYFGFPCLSFRNAPYSCIQLHVAFTRRLEGNFPTNNVLSEIEVCLIQNTPNSPLPVTLSALPSALPFFQPTLTRRTRGHCLGIGNLRSSISVMSVLVSTFKWWNIKYMSVYLCSCWMSSEMQANLPQITWGCYGDCGAMYFLRRLLYREDGGSMRLRKWVTPCHTVR